MSGRRFRRAILLMAALGAAALGLLFAALWVEHALPMELPRPTGLCGVGAVDKAGR